MSHQTGQGKTRKGQHIHTTVLVRAPSRRGQSHAHQTHCDYDRWRYSQHGGANRAVRREQPDGEGNLKCVTPQRRLGTSQTHDLCPNSIPGRHDVGVGLEGKCECRRTLLTASVVVAFPRLAALVPAAASPAAAAGLSQAPLCLKQPVRPSVDWQGMHSFLLLAQGDHLIGDVKLDALLRVPKRLRNGVLWKAGVHHITVDYTTPFLAQHNNTMASRNEVLPQ